MKAGDQRFASAAKAGKRNLQGMFSGLTRWNQKNLAFCPLNRVVRLYHVG